MSRNRTKIYVGNLGQNGRESDIEHTFRKYGELRSVWVARHPAGFAFIEYEDPYDAEDAVNAMDGGMCCGERVKVEFSTMRPRSRGRGPPPRRQRFDPNDVCYNCGRQGHYAYDCTRRKSSRRSRSRSRSPRRRRSSSRGRSYSRSPKRSSRDRSSRDRSPRDRSPRDRSSRRRSRSRSHSESRRSRSHSRSAPPRSRSRSKSHHSRSRSKSKPRSRTGSPAARDEQTNGDAE